MSEEGKNTKPVANPRREYVGDQMPKAPLSPATWLNTNGPKPDVEKQQPRAPLPGPSEPLPDAQQPRAPSPTPAAPLPTTTPSKRKK